MWTPKASSRGLTGRRRSPISWMGKPNSTLNKGKWIRYSLNQMAMTVATLHVRDLTLSAGYTGMCCVTMHSTALQTAQELTKKAECI